MLQMTKDTATTYGAPSRDLAELIHTPARSGRARATALAALVGVAMGALLSASSAFANPAGEEGRIAQEHRACAVVLGLDPSEAPYQDCVASLERNLPQADASLASSGPRSADEMHQKASAACADVGLDERGSAFSQCVADLDATLSYQGQFFR